jgi:chorismate mutase / prephenate dehydrogenase
MAERRIEQLREQIDALNTELLDLLARRLDISVEIGAIKQEAGLPLYSEDRERDLLLRFRTAAIERDIDPDYVEELMTVVLVHSRAAQRKTNRESGAS